MGEEFDYVEEFQQFDYEQVKVDFEELMIDLQDWWLVDYGYYGFFFIWMVWYSVGMYCVYDGCGGVFGGYQCFLLISSWLDNVNFDKVC